MHFQALEDALQTASLCALLLYELGVPTGSDDLVFEKLCCSLIAKCIESNQVFYSSIATYSLSFHPGGYSHAST